MAYLQKWWYQKAKIKPTGVSDSGHGASGLQKSVILLWAPEGAAQLAQCQAGCALCGAIVLDLAGLP